MVIVFCSLRAEVGIDVIFVGRVGGRLGAENAGHLIFGNREGVVLGILAAQCSQVTQQSMHHLAGWILERL